MCSLSPLDTLWSLSTGPNRWICVYTEETHMPLGRMNPTCSGTPDYLLSEWSHEELDIAVSALQLKKWKGTNSHWEVQMFTKLREKLTTFSFLPPSLLPISLLASPLLLFPHIYSPWQSQLKFGGRNKNLNDLGFYLPLPNSVLNSIWLIKS